MIDITLSPHVSSIPLSFILSRLSDRLRIFLISYRYVIRFKSNMRILHNDLGKNVIIRNPYPYKQYGSDKSTILFKSYLYDNPDLLMLLIRGENNVLTCDCKHKKCSSSALCSVLSELQCVTEPLLFHRSIQRSGETRITSFGHTSVVTQKVRDILNGVPQGLVEWKRDETYSSFRLVDLIIISMFSTVVSTSGEDL